MNNKAFTLAEVLITLGIIGVVAALTLPTLIQNVQGKIHAEQVRTVKYKFTKATDKMKSLGLIGPYDSTAAFVAELQKHLKISKVCTSSNLRSCWPYDKVILQDGREYDISQVQTGKQFKMKSDENSDYSSPNVGIVTADGIPMILSYNKKCPALDHAKEYGWSTEDNKPISNATAGCVAAVFEINGTKKPNKQNQDVILFNANGLGSSCAIELDGGKCLTTPFSPVPVTKSECQQMKTKNMVENCSSENDYWAGVVKQCNGKSNMPSLTELGKIAAAIYKGSPSVGAQDMVSGLKYNPSNETGLPEPYFWVWSNDEVSAYNARTRNFYPPSTEVGLAGRSAVGGVALCVGE